MCRLRLAAYAALAALSCATGFSAGTAFDLCLLSSGRCSVHLLKAASRHRLGREGCAFRARVREPRNAVAASPVSCSAAVEERTRGAGSAVAALALSSAKEAAAAVESGHGRAQDAGVARLYHSIKMHDDDAAKTQDLPWIAEAGPQVPAVVSPRYAARIRRQCVCVASAQ